MQCMLLLKKPTPRRRYCSRTDFVGITSKVLVIVPGTPEFWLCLPPQRVCCVQHKRRMLI